MSVIALASGILGLGQVAYGWWQQREAKKELENMEMPEMSVPKSVNRAVSLAEDRAMRGLPLDKMEGAARRSSASSVAAIREGARSPMEYIEGVTSTFRSELDEMNKIALQDVMYRAEAERDIGNRLMEKGRYEARVDEAKMNDYYRRMDIVSQAGNAGMQNIFGGLDTAITAGVQWDTQRFEKKQHNDWMDVQRARFGITDKEESGGFFLPNEEAKKLVWNKDAYAQMEKSKDMWQYQWNGGMYQGGSGKYELGYRK